MYPEPGEEYKDDPREIDLVEEIPAADFYAEDGAQRNHYQGGCEYQHTANDQNIV